MIETYTNKDEMKIFNVPFHRQLRTNHHPLKGRHSVEEVLGGNQCRQHDKAACEDV